MPNITTAITRKDQTNLIKNTTLENLLKEIDDSKTKKRNQELENIRKSRLIKRIASVYYFLRTECGMERSRFMSFEEFKETEEFLKKRALNTIKKHWVLRWILPSYRSARYFLENSFFDLSYAHGISWYPEFNSSLLKNLLRKSREIEPSGCCHDCSMARGYGSHISHEHLFPLANNLEELFTQLNEIECAQDREQGSD